MSAALNNVLAQLASKDRACAALANEIRLKRHAITQQHQRLETLAAKKQHFAAQASRLSRLTKELVEAYTLSAASCVAAEKSIQEKITQSAAMRVRRESARREADDQDELLANLVAEAQAGVSSYCLVEN